MQGSGVIFVVLAVLSMLFVLWPLRALLFRAWQPTVVDREGENLALYRDHLRELEASKADGRIDEEQFQVLKREMDRNLLDEVPADTSKPLSAGPARNFVIGIFVSVAILVPLGSVYLYQHLGAADTLAITELEQQMHQLGNDVVSAEREGRANAGELRRRFSVVQAEFIESLESYLRRKPEDVQNWYLLARSFMATGDFAGAVRAYQEILKREPEAVQIMAELAQAQFLANDSRMNPVIEDLAKRVLKVDAENSTALGLAGIAAFGAEQYQAAIDYWIRAVRLIPAGTGGAIALNAGIERARELLAENGGEVTQTQPATTTASAGASIQVRVALADSVKSKPGDTVFIYARAWNGPKMPLAIAKLTVSDLPASVELTEAMAMMPAMTIKSFPELELVARISEDGSPAAKPGEWQASVGPVQLNSLSAPVELTISSQVQ